jgi:hypothetical protein
MSSYQDDNAQNNLFVEYTLTMFKFKCDIIEIEQPGRKAYKIKRLAQGEPFCFPWTIRKNFYSVFYVKHIAGSIGNAVQFAEIRQRSWR